MVIGTCSICSGPVDDTYSLSGAPKCRSCGATKRMPYGPVIDMEPCKTPAHPHPMDHLRPFPFTTLPPKDSIEDVLQRERDKSRAIGIGTKLGDTEAFMGGGSMSLGRASKSSCTHVDDARREDAYNAIKDAFEKFVPGAKGSISVRRINLGD